MLMLHCHRLFAVSDRLLYM